MALRPQSLPPVPYIVALPEFPWLTTRYREIRYE
jgi:hypothetical protein